MPDLIGRARFYAFLLGVSLAAGCADKPPVMIEDRSVLAEDDIPEVRQAAANNTDYGPLLAAGPDYVVVPGDTLYAVAFRLGMDYRTLAERNAIDPPFIIRVGQALKTVPGAAVTANRVEPKPVAPAQRPVVSDDKSDPAPAPVARESSTAPPSHSLSTAKTAAPNIPIDQWSWPAEGRVSRAYSEERHKGIDLSGTRGSPVTATAAGVVVYAGTGVTGYGALLIIKHNDSYLSAYGHNDSLMAAEGQSVEAGQVIAGMGSTSSDSVKLHFEIRRNGRPIDPMTLLPQR
jgi:lipoprotein NlpD